MDNEIYQLCCLVSKLMYDNQALLVNQNKDKSNFNEILEALGEDYFLNFGIPFDGFENH